MKFPQRLSRARRKARLTQAELARRLDRSRSAVCEWEKGIREPSLDTLREIAKELGCSAGELVD